MQYVIPISTGASLFVFIICCEVNILQLDLVDLQYAGGLPFVRYKHLIAALVDRTSASACLYKHPWLTCQSQ